MFGYCGQLNLKTLSRHQYLSSGHVFSKFDENLRYLTTWNYRSKHAVERKKIGIQINKRCVLTNISEGLSHFHNPVTYPLRDITAGQLLAETVEKWPNRECLVSTHQNVRLTFSEVLRRADKLAAGLIKLGLQRGDRIGLWGPNDYEWFISFIATVRAGFIMVGINPAYQQSEIDYCLQKVSASCVIASKPFKCQNYGKMLLSAKERCPSLQHIIIYSEDHVTGTRRFVDVESLANNAEVQAVAEMQNEISPFEGCNIQFTSGTTGNPKATLLSHRSFVNNSKQGAERSGLTNGHHKVCLNVPFFHAFGMVMGIFSGLHAGSTTFLESPSFNPKLSVETILREKCSASYGTPTMWINVMDARERLKVPIDTLQIGITGGAVSSSHLLERIRKELGCGGIQNIYGLTETTAIAFQSTLNDSRDNLDNTVGFLSDHIEAMVVDEHQSPVPIGSPGELWIRGYSNMMKYWDDEENTKKTITEDGWLKTGDQFILREDGYGQVVGRLKDIIIRGGENIFPKEIEHFLESHPDIVEAHVFGVHDDVYGEEICACVRLSDGVKMTQYELQSYGKGKIAHYKIPRYISFVDTFPRTTSGKIRKFKMREELENRGVIPSKPTT